MVMFAEVAAYASVTPALLSATDIEKITQIADLIKIIVTMGVSVMSFIVMCIINREKIAVFIESIKKRRKKE